MPRNVPHPLSFTALHPREFGLRWVSLDQRRQSRIPLPLLFLLVSVTVLVFISSHPRRGAPVTTWHVCTSRDLPNPLAELYPKNATGVLNATLVIIPVPLETARRLIPPQHGILERAYRTLLPNFPDGMYPVMMQAAHDHDVQFRAYGFTLDDFSVSVLVGQTCTWYCAD